MSNIRALDELREVVRCGQGHGFSSSKAYYDTLGGCIAEIEREVSERFVELPVDAYGVPIRCDDVMEGVTRWEGERFKVYCMEIYPDGHWEVTDDDTCDSIRATECRHYKPRTIEDVLFSFWHEFGRESEWKGLEGRIGEYADEIRELRGDAE